MGKVDEITIKGMQSPCFNIDRRVGRGGANMAGDVAIIQAYLNFIHPYDVLYNNGEAVPVAPEVTGRYDDALAGAIGTYQRWAAGRLISSDGAIDPAFYENRNLKDVYNPLMTITFLHVHAKNANKNYPYPNYVQGIIANTPIVVVLNPRIMMQSLAAFKRLGTLFK